MFRFVDNDLNNKLIAKLRIANKITDTEIDCYDEIIDIICSFRTELFPEWQIISFPQECMHVYAHYMVTHNIRFYLEFKDGEFQFLISKHYRPHAWKLLL